jgi:hypothetical protein
MNRDDLALALRVVATEAAEEPNAIVGHPEIFDALDSVASDDQLVTCF